MHKYFWDNWTAFEERGEFVNTEQKINFALQRKF